MTHIMNNTRYKILLVEDDEVNQKAFSQLVEREGLPYDHVIRNRVAEATSEKDQHLRCICLWKANQPK
jgi:CheY-like chemotaxis protein